jgi:hypothetical protein
MCTATGSTHARRTGSVALPEGRDCGVRVILPTSGDLVGTGTEPATSERHVEQRRLCSGSSLGSVVRGRDSAERAAAHRGVHNEALPWHSDGSGGLAHTGGRIWHVSGALCARASAQAPPFTGSLASRSVGHARHRILSEEQRGLWGLVRTGVCAQRRAPCAPVPGRSLLWR